MLTPYTISFRNLLLLKKKKMPRSTLSLPSGSFCQIQLEKKGRKNSPPKHGKDNTD